MGQHIREMDWQAGACAVPLPVRSAPSVARSARGHMAHLAGAMAEDQVLTKYLRSGYELVARRWRGQAGEIDLILRQGDCLVFVEVKRSSSHAAAAERLGRRQMNRICLAGCEFCGGQPGGQLSEMRFDVALVDGIGRIDVLENAFGADW